MRPTILTLALFTLAAPLGSAQVAPPDVCPGHRSCSESREFAAMVTDFRLSLLDRGGRMVTATIRFQNKANRPLVLGYVDGSAIATDDQGNRYGTWTPANVRGIGLITTRTFDPKFVLQPGETGDARIEMAWRPTAAGQLFGTSWAMELTVRAIDPVAGNQFRLGKEYALQYRGLANAADIAGTAGTPGNTGGAAATPLSNPAPAAAVAPVDDPCAGKSRCYSEGPFLAEVTAVTPSIVGNRHHVVEVRIRFRNLTSQPIILGYQNASGGGVDNNGNRYFYGRAGTYDGSVKGMGIVLPRSADPQFVLSPGESRTANFSMIRYNSGTTGLGTSWSYEAAIVQLEVLAGNQVRSARQYSLSFKEISAAAPAPNPAGVVNGLIDVLTKKKKP